MHKWAGRIKKVEKRSGKKKWKKEVEKRSVISSINQMVLTNMD
jgi:hypothetical protein